MADKFFLLGEAPACRQAGFPTLLICMHIRGIDEITFGVLVLTYKKTGPLAPFKLL
jgi:hypothetical protein